MKPVQSRPSTAVDVFRKSMTFKILTLNNISLRGLERLPRDRYEDRIRDRASGCCAAALSRHAQDGDSRFGQGGGPCRRWRQQHPGREVSASAAFRYSTPRRQCERGEGTRDCRDVSRRTQHLPCVGIRARHSRATITRLKRRSRRARRNLSASNCRVGRSESLDSAPSASKLPMLPLDCG